MRLSKLAVMSLFFLTCGQAAFANWTRVETGTLAWLRSVFFVNEKKGWIVGGNGTFMVSNDGGISWQKVKKFTAENIIDVYFEDERKGWLLCERSIYDANGKRLASVMTTDDGGESWETLPIGEGNNRLARLFFSKGGNGFAIGEGGVLWLKPRNEKTWKKSVLPMRNLFLDGKFLDNNYGFLVGGGGAVIQTDDGGKNWNWTTLSGGVSGFRLNAVTFVDKETGWTVGSSGAIFRTVNGGKSWTPQHSVTNENLNDVFFANSIDGIAAGDNGTILQTNDGGATWELRKTGTRHKLERVFAANGKALVVGMGGVVLSGSMKHRS